MLQQLFLLLLSSHIEPSRVEINRKVANPVHGQLNREKFPCSRSRLEIWFRETDLAVPSRVSLLILHTQAESGAYSRDCSRCPRRHPYIYFSHTHYDTKYVQIQNISTAVALELLFGGTVFSPRLIVCSLHV